MRKPNGYGSIKKLSMFLCLSVEQYRKSGDQGTSTLIPAFIMLSVLQW